MRYCITEKTAYWQTFVDILTSCLFVLIVFLILSRFSEELFRISKRKEIQEEIKSKIESLALESGRANCDSALGKAKYVITLSADSLFYMGEYITNYPDDIITLGTVLKTIFENEKYTKDSIFNYLEVQGHTDIIPLGKTMKENIISNWGLSSLRAVSVSHILIDAVGFSPKQIRAVGCGQYEPKVYKDYGNDRGYISFIKDIFKFTEKMTSRQKNDILLMAANSLSPNRRIELVIYFNEKAVISK